MEFQKSSFGASAAWSHERAAPLITLPDDASHRGRDVTRVPRRCVEWTRAIGRRQLLLLQFVDEDGERLIEDLAGIAVWDRVSQQILGTAELIVRLATDGELDLESLRRQLLNVRAGLR
jgi:hypothetical protein